MAGADEQLLCGLLSNRGLALMYSERFGEARHDLERARSIAEERTLTYLHGVTVQNLGCLAVRNGDVPGALSSSPRPLLWFPQRGRPRCGWTARTRSSPPA